MSGRADLRATASRLRREYGHLLDGNDRHLPAPPAVLERLQEARERVTGRPARSRGAQLELDLSPPPELNKAD